MSTPRPYTPICDDKGSPRWEVSAPDQAIILAEGEFLVYARNTGYTWIVRPTGRTRKMFGGVTMVSLERFVIDTVVKGDDETGAFAIWGERGERVPGLVYVREDCPKVSA